MDLTDPQQWNAYSYSNNNPVTYSDPSGLSPVCGIEGGGGDCSSAPSSAPPDTNELGTGGGTNEEKCTNLKGCEPETQDCSVPGVTCPNVTLAIPTDAGKDLVFSAG